MYQWKPQGKMDILHVKSAINNNKKQMKYPLFIRYENINEQGIFGFLHI